MFDFAVVKNCTVDVFANVYGVIFSNIYALLYVRRY